MQQVVAVARHREALRYFRQGLHMGLEILPRAYRVLVHADRQHYVYLESQPSRIQQGDFAFDQARVLELADSPPDGTARHSGALGEIDLADAQIILQCTQQLVIGPAQVSHEKCLKNDSYMKYISQ